MAYQCLLLNDNESVIGMRKEMRNRRDSAYIILDKTKKYVFLLQKLPYAENYVNTHVADSKETKISLTGLYGICDNIDNKVGGFIK